MAGMVHLLCVGSLKEPFYKAAFEEYRKRLNGLCRFTVEEIPEQRPAGASQKAILAALEREADAIETRIPRQSVLCACCVEGTMLDSAAFSDWLAAQGSVCVLIGSSNGLAERLKQRAALRLSLSRMTFPHHLFRVMAAEQLYRAFAIQAGMKYHK